jgi:5-formyltetrahydrofolate cyclo-ligase
MVKGPFSERSTIMMALPTTKEQLRAHFLELRRQLPLERRLASTHALAQRLLSQEISSGYVMSFMSYRGEINTSLLNTELANQGRLLLPRVEHHRLRPYHVTHFPQQIVKGYGGILEPNPLHCQTVNPAEIAVVLVPGLVFDQRFHRLGYGQGHYDRFLSSLQDCLKIGIGFSEQLLSFDLPDEVHDEPLNRLCLV